jgi:hypothetical protein
MVLPDPEVEALVKAFRESDLDCAQWDDGPLRELAVLASEVIDALRQSEDYAGELVE